MQIIGNNAIANYDENDNFGRAVAHAVHSIDDVRIREQTQLSETHSVVG